LTELILREHDMTVDTEGFDVEMQKQKERARNAAVVETGDWVKIHDGEPVFTGYDEVESRTQILRYRSVKQKIRIIIKLSSRDRHSMPRWEVR